MNPKLFLEISSWVQWRQLVEEARKKLTLLSFSFTVGSSLTLNSGMIFIHT
jgi:hypothetical protein